MAPLPTVEPPRARIGPLTSCYARLPAHYFVRLTPVPVAEPHLIQVSRPLAAELGLDFDSDLRVDFRTG